MKKQNKRTQPGKKFSKPCMKIQWGELSLKDGKPVCPSCGAPAEQIITFFGSPGWAHASS